MIRRNQLRDWGKSVKSFFNANVSFDGNQILLRSNEDEIPLCGNEMLQGSNENPMPLRGNENEDEDFLRHG